MSEVVESIVQGGDKGHGLLGDGNISVKNFEELASTILDVSVEKLLPSEKASKDDLNRFYDVDLPKQVLTSGGSQSPSAS